MAITFKVRAFGFEGGLLRFGKLDGLREGMNFGHPRCLTVAETFWRLFSGAYVSIQREAARGGELMFHALGRV
jgi:hypothetical protein